MKMKKFYQEGILVCAILILSFAMMNLTAKAAVVYSDDNTIFARRTPQEVAKQYSIAKNAGETYVDMDRDTYYSIPASTKAPYHQGELTDDTLKTMQGMTDFYRWLVGVDALKVNCTQNESLQYQALDRNFEFNHNISESSKPDDMDEELWEKGFACQHHILYWGSSPQNAIIAWMNEGYSLTSNSWNTTGHRYALLDPTHTEVQFGFCGAIGIGAYKMTSGETYQEDFSAFPAAGYMPNNLVRPSSCAWTVQLKESKIKVQDRSKVQVTITNQRTGENFVRSAADSTISTGTTHVSFAQPSDYSGVRYTDTYNVKVTGLTDVKTGDDAIVTYDVKFFDVSELEDSYVTAVEGEKISKIYLYEGLNDTESLKKIATLIPKEVVVKAASGKQMHFTVEGEWVLDEERKCYVNTVDASQLPEYITDKNEMLKDVCIPYLLTTSAAYWLRVTRTTMLEGESGNFGMRKANANYQHCKIFKLEKTDEESYQSQLRFDSESSKEYDTEYSSDYYAYFNIEAFNLEDSGEYIAMHYSDISNVKNAYISSSILQLTVNHDYREILKAATCTEGGYTTYTCAVCGDEYVDEYTDALGHDYDVRVTEPTCTEGGYTTHTCTRCGDEYVDEYTDALGHDYDVRVTEPTCTEGGYTTHTCTRCGDEYVDEYTDALGHHYDRVVFEPDCVNSGYLMYTCIVCGDRFIEDYALPLGHVFLVDGVQQRYCQECGVENPDYVEETTTEELEETTVEETMTEIPQKTTTEELPTDDNQETTEELPTHNNWETTEESGELTTDITEYSTTDKTEETKTTVTEEPETSVFEEQTTGELVIPITAVEKPTTGDMVTTVIETTSYPSVVKINQAVLDMKNDKDPSGSMFGLLQAQVKKTTKKSQKIQWKKVSGAAGYIVYHNVCGKPYQKLKTVTKNSLTCKKLKKGKYYKYLIVAYNAKGEVIAISKTIHAATKGGKYCNFKSVKPKKTKVVLGAGTTYTIKAKQVKESKKKKVKKHRGVSYESSNPLIATVTGKGVVKGVDKGTCTIYVYAQNGVFKKVTVTVK